MDELWVCQLGEVEYGEALALQARLREARAAGAIPDTMLLLEHPAVITRGRRAAAEDLPLPEAWYRERGVEIVGVNRGGKLTYHGPGQLVGYPIVAVTDVVAYVRRLEAALVAALLAHGIVARARPEDGPDYTGVWVGDAKIASIGVHVAQGVTTHGFALNVSNDMTPWGWFTACGLASVAMTSVIEQTGPAGADTAREPGPEGGPDDLACLRRRMGAAVAEALGRRQRLMSAARLEAALAAAAPALAGG